jgi:hypothetical protein
MNINPTIVAPKQHARAEELNDIHGAIQVETRALRDPVKSRRATSSTPIHTPVVGHLRSTMLPLAGQPTPSVPEEYSRLFDDCTEKAGERVSERAARPATSNFRRSRFVYTCVTR